MVWGVIATTVRQRATPGRVGGAYAPLDSCGTVAGMPLGGLPPHALGITAPFWAAGAVTALVTAVAWRPLSEGDTPRG
jgi:predicted MFS family arabinose efflux permease